MNTRTLSFIDFQLTSIRELIDIENCGGTRYNHQLLAHAEQAFLSYLDNIYIHKLDSKPKSVILNLVSLFKLCNSKFCQRALSNIFNYVDKLVQVSDSMSSESPKINILYSSCDRKHLESIDLFNNSYFIIMNG
jgi:hypothetical protein